MAQVGGILEKGNRSGKKEDHPIPLFGEDNGCLKFAGCLLANVGWLTGDYYERELHRFFLLTDHQRQSNCKIVMKRMHAASSTSCIFSTIPWFSFTTDLLSVSC